MRSPASLIPIGCFGPQTASQKQGLADYYAGAAAWILPHLVGRPLGSVRCPEGLTGECFYAKQAWGRDWPPSCDAIAVGEGHTALMVDDIDGLLALVQGSVLEIHPWGSSLKDLERPERTIFDLDPGEDVAWGSVIAAALEVRDRLRASLKLESFVKTTGGEGLFTLWPPSFPR